MRNSTKTKPRTKLWPRMWYCTFVSSLSECEKSAEKAGWGHGKWEVEWSEPTRTNDVLYILFCKYLHGGVRQLFFCSCKGRRGLTHCLLSQRYLHQTMSPFTNRSVEKKGRRGSCLLAVIICLFIVCKVVRVLTNFAKALLLLLLSFFSFFELDLHDYFKQAACLHGVWMIFLWAPNLVCLLPWVPSCFAMFARFDFSNEWSNLFRSHSHLFPPLLHSPHFFFIWAHSFSLSAHRNFMVSCLAYSRCWLSSTKCVVQQFSKNIPPSFLQTIDHAQLNEDNKNKK